jgi:hypothetical protein
VLLDANQVNLLALPQETAQPGERVIPLPDHGPELKIPQPELLVQLATERALP